jgi:3-deoxy-manno-octulosonate cytidylyltransferase (CMP-KDO synthetase)
MMKVVAIIPARYGSTRFPGKPLADIDGKSMIRRVIDRASAVDAFSEVIVATDDERIAAHVRGYGAKVVMTSADHPSGTDRCLEAMDRLAPDADVVVNVQGDEPFVDTEQLKALIDLMGKSDVDIATLRIRISDLKTLHDPNKVKVVVNENGKALYFSRHAIPYQKSVPEEHWLDHFNYYKHLGLYAYRSDVLRKICTLKPSPLELAESLEQLRWLEGGYSIHVAETDIETPAIDTPDDLNKAIHFLRNS